MYWCAAGGSCEAALRLRWGLLGLFWGVLGCFGVLWKEHRGALVLCRLYWGIWGVQGPCQWCAGEGTGAVLGPYWGCGVRASAVPGRIPERSSLWTGLGGV